MGQATRAGAAAVAGRPRVTHDDAELDELRARVDCRTVLEQAGWDLDRRESTARALKYRNGPARIVIVTHGGKGWFDPLSDAKGDVLALAQRVWGGNLGHARRALRPLAGIAPSLAPALREREHRPALDAARTWRRARRPAPGSPAWRYLVEARRLPAETVARAVAADALREGIEGTAWALHRARADGAPTGWEMRGPRYKGFARGGDKGLFFVGDPVRARRLAVAEGFIDALSLAAVEGWPEGTAYLSTGGGFGPATAEALLALLSDRVRLVAATDQGAGGELLADRLHGLAREAGAGFGRLRPSAKDWNAQLAEAAGHGR